MDGYILALDQGTTSSRAHIIDSSGQIIASAQHPFKQIYPAAGWVEHDPFDILETQLRAAGEAFAQSDLSPSDIAAIGIANQRETTIVWDKHTGKPVCNAIVWQCRRTAEICNELIASGLSEYVQEKTGLVIDAYFSATKLKWILDNVKGAREAADKGQLLFGTVETWLIWNLTGGAEHVSDCANASRTMLFDIDKLCWDDELLKAIDIPDSVLPRPVPCMDSMGKIAKGIKHMESLEGIPICAAAGDQQAALFGQCCFEPGLAKNTYGTGCFLLANCGDERPRSRHGLVTSIAWNTNTQKIYALEGSAFNTGSAIQWLRDELGLIESAKECDKLAETVENSGGAFFVPAFTGLGAPYWDMDARGLLCGLTRGTTRAHVARAVLESIAFQTADLCAAMELDLGFCLRELRVDGGASASDVLMAFQADILGMNINRPQNTESTVLGAAFMAGLAVGLWSDTARLSTMRKTQRVFHPAMSSERRDGLYKGWKQAIARTRSF